MSKRKKKNQARRNDIERLIAIIAQDMGEGLFGRTEAYVERVGELFTAATDALTKLASGTDFDPATDVFSFSDSKRMSEKSAAILRGLYSAVYNEVKSAVITEWGNANSTTDRLIAAALGNDVKDDKRFARLFARNREAVDSFFSRKSEYGGLNLSQRVWKYTGQFKEEMELALSASLGRGDSAATVSRKVRQYLQEPDRLFRRVRDEEGNLKLSKRAAAYHPGRGEYRSSYKNAMRMTRTEVNAAYRAADCDRWSQIDFIVGVEVKRSNHPFACSVCEALAGKYPKDFKFVGWHPQCRCYIVPVMADYDQRMAYHKAVLDGEDVSGWKFDGEIAEPHEGFQKWMKDNADRVEKAAEKGTLPYWMKDNPEYTSSASIPKAANGTTQTSTTATAPLVTPETDREAFRQLQKETSREIAEHGKLEFSHDGLYTGQLYLGKNERRNIINHCFDTEELDAAKQLPSILGHINKGRYQPIDMSRPNYKAKMKNGIRNYVVYETNVNGTIYELKCSVMRDSGNHKRVKEFPYSFKKKKS